MYNFLGFQIQVTNKLLNRLIDTRLSIDIYSIAIKHIEEIQHFEDTKNRHQTEQLYHKSTSGQLHL